MMRVDHHSPNAVAGEIPQLPGQQRLAADVDQRLRHVRLDRREARSASGGEDHRVHERSLA